MRKEILRMERVTYREQGMTQLENFNIAIKAGEIIGMVPVNHVGLAAFIRLLQQNLPLHYGYVYYQEKMVNHWRFPTMKYNRISVIQNRSSLAGGLTVADNVFVLRQGFRKCMVQPKVLRQQLQPPQAAIAAPRAGPIDCVGQPHKCPIAAPQQPAP